MSIERIASDFGNFSDLLIVEGPGKWIFISGQVGFDDSGKAVVAGGVGAETSVIFDQMERELSALGSGLHDIVRLTAYLTDLSSYAEFSAIRTERFAADPPTSAAVGVSDLLLSASVEIEGLAFIPVDRSV